MEYGKLKGGTRYKDLRLDEFFEAVNVIPVSLVNAAIILIRKNLDTYKKKDGSSNGSRFSFSVAATQSAGG